MQLVGVHLPVAVHHGSGFGWQDAGRLASWNGTCHAACGGRGGRMDVVGLRKDSEVDEEFVVLCCVYMYIYICVCECFLLGWGVHLYIVVLEFAV